MKKRNLLLAIAFVFGLSGLYAQSCTDWNEYVDSKNTVPGTDYYLLQSWAEHSAAQAYHYSGPGRILSAEITGKNASYGSHSHLTVYVYNVDANNRPTGYPLATTYKTWYGSSPSTKTVSFGYYGSGVNVSANFAIVVKVNYSYGGSQFELAYTGDGEGAGEDLPSVRSSVNWSSMLPAKDGDFYLVPKMQHDITADFVASATCNATGQDVDFTNTTTMTEDRMFNTINLSGYSGGMNLYSWDFGDPGSGVLNTSTLENPTHAYSTEGVYTVTLTSTVDTWPMGGSSCSDTKTMQVSVGLDVTGVGTNLNCNGDNSGSITLTGSGGDNSSYSYSLNGSSWQASNVFTGLTAGTYITSIRDGFGCDEDGNTVTISEPSLIELSSTMGVTMATCGNSDGSLIVTASGGIGTLTYSLDNSTYQATGEFNNLAAGTITIYVKDATGCVVSPTVVLENTTAPTVSLQAYSNVSCKSGNDGTITLLGSGGTGTLEYSIDGVNFQASNVFSTVSAGFYTPSAKDAAGCIGAFNCVSGPCGVSISEPVTGITFSLSSTDVSCNGGSDGELTVLSPIGGTGTMSFSINGTDFQSGTNFPNLSAYTYNVTVKDILGCTATSPIVVGEPDLLVASISSTTDVSCNSFADGEFVAAATGGVGSYAYSLDGNLFYPGSDFYSLMAGTYTVDVIDGNYCEASTTVTLTEPTAITAVITTGNSTCGSANGTMLATAAGGFGSGYLYSIDGNETTNGTGAFSALAADNYFVIVTDGDGCEQEFDATVTDSDGPVIASFTSTDVTCNDGKDGTVTITSVTGGTGTILYSIDGGAFQSSNSFIGLGSGQHLVAVEDANGCFNSSTITLTQPSPFAIILSGTDVICNGDNSGTITVNAAGGSGTLVYSVDAVNFQSSTLLQGISAGDYNVYVRDAGGCIGSDTISISEPDAIDIATNALNVTCAGASDGVVNANAIGGTGTFTYNMDNSGYQPTGTFTGVSGGLHVILAKDGANCVEFVSVFVDEPTLLELNSSISDVSCAGGDDGVIDVDVQGGTTPYTYAWSNHKETEDIFNLEAGSYSVDVVDGNGCTISDNFTVSEPSNPIVVNGTTTNATGASVADGSIDVTITGGTAPYSYDWSNGETMEDNSGLIPGVYSIIVTDANGCTSTAGFTISWNVGINDVTEESTLRIFPNPASNIINIEQEGVIIDKITLINSIGELVKEVYPTNEKVQFEISQYHRGIYLLQVQIDGEVLTKRITIMK